MTTPGIEHDRPVPGAPWLPRHYARREHLWGLLDESTEHPATMVVAPAGAGKTMGVAGWLLGRPHARRPIWYAATPASPAGDLEAVLAAAAESPGTPALVVVDDAHLLPAACVRLLGERLSSAPATMRLVLLARWDVAIPRLVPELLGHLTVLRGDVLRLTREESTWLAGRHAPAAPADVLDAIADRADGWCAAVVLAARASATMSGARDVADVLRTSTGSLADLVAGEVFVGLRPPERHLLLSIADEPGITEETARHLTRDPRAGEILATLEATGLLVSRVAAGPGAAEHYRVHPLLLEVVRRRLVAGGVDVQRARATLVRAARDDLGLGRAEVALRRFMAAGACDEAAAVVAGHGLRILLSGERRWIDGFARAADGLLVDHPETWGVLARARWSAGDAEGGRYWADRLIAHEEAHPGSVPPLELLDIRLHRSRAGSEHPAAAVAAAREVLARALAGGSATGPRVALLHLEVGVLENWLGDLDDAEEHLSAAVQLCHGEGLAVAGAEAMSHLALTQFMLGREQACLRLAQDVLDRLADDEPGPRSATRSRAELARMLVWFGCFPALADPTSADPATTPEPVDPSTWALPETLDDPTGRFWLAIMRARLELLGGSVPDAMRDLEVLAPRRGLPRHLRVCALMEQSGVAVISGNRAALRSLDEELRASGADAEALWVEAAGHDVAGDLRTALDLYAQAAARAERKQPPTAVVAATCAAQVADHLGRTDAARAQLRHAVDASAGRRLGSPFLGWSRHGTRIGQLLAGTPDVDAPSWRAELRDACADLPGIAAMFAPVVATPKELAAVADAHPVPALSPRELEVLLELARGSTYSDAAANLFVSENTVKTHVSSLYSKLSVGRRSEALAVARKLHLI